MRQVLQSKEVRRALPGLALSVTLSNLLALVLPLALMQIMDRIIPNQSIETLTALVIGVMIVMILESTLRSVSSRITGWLGARLEHNTGVMALDRTMNLHLQDFQSQKPAAYVERILGSTKIAQFYSGQGLLVLFEMPFVGIFLATIWIIGGYLVLIPIVLLCIFAWFILRFGHRMRAQIEERSVMDDRRLDFLTEVLANMQSVKAMGVDAQLLRRYERLQASNAVTGEKLTHGNALSGDLSALFAQIMSAGVVFAGAWSVIDGHMTPGGLGACMMLSVRALQPLRAGLSAWMRYQSFASAWQRLADLFAMPCEANIKQPALPKVTQGIELRGIRLQHEEASTPLFSDISLSIPAGQCVAIVGNNGSGKSNLLSFINGMMRPDAGEILIDGRPLSSFSPDSVHREIALLPQYSTLVAGTILENITMFNPKLNAEALAIAKQIGLDREVAHMKMGYETPLEGGAGGVLTEGLAQLITIARALVRSPSVILFDEANIPLDMRTDALLREYLVNRKGQAILILVTYRPSWLSMADKVYRLEGGHLHETDVAAVKAANAEIEAEITAPVADRPQSSERIVEIVRRQFEEAVDLSECLLPLLDVIGWEGTPTDLVEAMPHLEKQLNLSGLCSTLSNLGYPPRHFTGSLAQLDRRLLPCLFVPRGRPASVISEVQTEDGSVKPGVLKVYDIATSTWKEVTPGNLIGEIYTFRRKEEKEERKAGEKWFNALLWRLRPHLIVVFLLTVLTTLLGLASPLFVMIIYDRVIPSGNVMMGGFLLMGFGIATAMEWMLRGLKSRLMAYIGGRTEYLLGTGLFQKILSLPISAVGSASVDRQVSRIKNLEGLREFFVGPLTMLAFDLPANLLLLIVIGLINPWIVMIVLLFAIAFALLGMTVSPLTERSMMKSSKHSGARWEFLNGTLLQMRGLRTMGVRGMWTRRYRDMSAKSVLSRFHDSQVQFGVGSVAQVLGMLTGLVALAVSAWLTIEGELTGGAMMATTMIVWRVTGPMQNIFMSTGPLTQFKMQLQRLENLMRMPGEQGAGVRQAIRPDMEGSININQASFRYGAESDPALLGINLVVKPGQVVVITGPTASGKSTLLKIIPRIYTPQAGTVRIDDIDIRQINAADLRARISYMSQEVTLFHGTVAQNLRLAYPSATDAAVHWSLEMAGLSKDIAAMPRGIDTRISGSQSERLPNGFLQRLALARTMLKPAPIVLFDEPGGGMDATGEEALLRCIGWLKGKATVLIVSNRPSHARLADHVLAMDQGAIVAQGTFEQMKAKLMPVAGVKK
ncbi:MAG: ATP-binding cassette domain-containing protein [Rhodocyclaceae bacterium]|nr:ATP-binding cassette domain-containing protein [Rhodocyclaceae bacterium]